MCCWIDKNTDFRLFLRYFLDSTDESFNKNGKWKNWICFSKEVYLLNDKDLSYPPFCQKHDFWALFWYFWKLNDETSQVHVYRMEYASAKNRNAKFLSDLPLNCQNLVSGFMALIKCDLDMVNMVCFQGPQLCFAMLLSAFKCLKTGLWPTISVLFKYLSV